MKREYLFLLLNQFALAKGIKNIDVNSTDFMNEFCAWIVERKKSGEDFKLVLDEMGYDYKSKKVVEANKSKHDSLILPYESTLITPFYEGLDVSHKRLYPALFGMSGITPTAYTDEYSVGVNLCFLNSFMINNPYDINYLYNAENLFNGNLVGGEVGFYGSTNDKDYENQMKLFEDFRDSIDGSYHEEHITMNDHYAMVLVSDNKVLKRTRTL